MVKNKIHSYKNFLEVFLLSSINATLLGAAKLSISFFTLREMISIMSPVALTAYNISWVCIKISSIVFMLNIYKKASHAYCINLHVHSPFLSASSTTSNTYAYLISFFMPKNRKS